MNRGPVVREGYIYIAALNFDPAILNSGVMQPFHR